MTQKAISIIIAAILATALTLPSDAVASSFPASENDTTVTESVSEKISLIEITYPSDALLSYPRAPKNPYKFHATELIAPGVMLGFGVWGLTNHWWKGINENIKDDLQDHRHHRIRIDNFTQFVPAVAGYGMNLFGFKGIHDTLDATIIYGTAYILLGVTLFPMKELIHSTRPNLKDNNSFPSGHTAIAFAGAELLRREYWNISPWIGVAGYAVAAGTGFLRMYNNAHWLNDVIAGAGLGILCAETAYWLYPLLSKAIFKKRAKANGFIAPALSATEIGVSAYINF